MALPRIGGREVSPIKKDGKIVRYADPKTGQTVQETVNIVEDRSGKVGTGVTRVTRTEEGTVFERGPGIEKGTVETKPSGVSQEEALSRQATPEALGQRALRGDKTAETALQYQAQYGAGTAQTRAEQQLEEVARSRIPPKQPEKVEVADIAPQEGTGTYQKARGVRPFDYLPEGFPGKDFEVDLVGSPTGSKGTEARYEIGVERFGQEAVLGVPSLIYNAGPLGDRESIGRGAIDSVVRIGSDLGSSDPEKAGSAGAEFSFNLAGLLPVPKVFRGAAKSTKAADIVRPLRSAETGKVAGFDVLTVFDIEGKKVGVGRLVGKEGEVGAIRGSVLEKIGTESAPVKESPNQIVGVPKGLAAPAEVIYVQGKFEPLFEKRSVPKEEQKVKGAVKEKPLGDQEFFFTSERRVLAEGGRVGSGFQLQEVLKSRGAAQVSKTISQPYYFEKAQLPESPKELARLSLEGAQLRIRNEFGDLLGRKDVTYEELKAYSEEVLKVPVIEENIQGGLEVSSPTKGVDSFIDTGPGKDELLYGSTYLAGETGSPYGIAIEKSLSPADKLVTLKHELVHALRPDLSEADVLKTETNLKFRKSVLPKFAEVKETPVKIEEVARASSKDLITELIGTPEARLRGGKLRVDEKVVGIEVAASKEVLDVTGKRDIVVTDEPFQEAYSAKPQAFKIELPDEQLRVREKGVEYDEFLGLEKVKGESVEISQRGYKEEKVLEDLADLPAGSEFVELRTSRFVEPDKARFLQQKADEVLLGRDLENRLAIFQDVGIEVFRAPSRRFDYSYLKEEEAAFSRTSQATARIEVAVDEKSAATGLRTDFRLDTSKQTRFVDLAYESGVEISPPGPGLEIGAAAAGPKIVIGGSKGKTRAASNLRQILEGGTGGVEKPAVKAFPIQKNRNALSVEALPRADTRPDFDLDVRPGLDISPKLEPALKAQPAVKAQPKLGAKLQPILRNILRGRTQSQARTIIVPPAIPGPKLRAKGVFSEKGGRKKGAKKSKKFFDDVAPNVDLGNLAISQQRFGKASIPTGKNVGKIYAQRVADYGVAATFPTAETIRYNMDVAGLSAPKRKGKRRK